MSVSVDMRMANRAIKRERHATLSEIISLLSNAKIFSKLDLNQGYNQLQQLKRKQMHYNFLNTYWLV